jgi:hypothetical protein
VYLARCVRVASVVILASQTTADSSPRGCVIVGPVSLWTRLWAPDRPRHLAALGELAAVRPQERVELDGVVEMLEALTCPVTGAAAVAIEYRAWPQSSMPGIDGLGAQHSRAFQVRRQQAADFLLRDGGQCVLVRVDRGQDVVAMHRELLARHGVGLRSEQHLIGAGARVRVVGRLEARGPASSPHRSEAHLAVVQAQRFWRVP